MVQSKLKSTENKLIQEMLKNHPLLNFSIYTHSQIKILTDFGNDILNTLNKFSQKIDGAEFEKAYGLIWLWILGAYEVLRTMKEAKDCFSEKIISDLLMLESKLSRIRVPFAKQQYKDNKSKNRHHEYVQGGELSVKFYGGKDIGYEIEGEIFSFRKLYSEFKKFTKQIKKDDIKNHIRNSKNNYTFPR